MQQKPAVTVHDVRMFLTNLSKNAETELAQMPQAERVRRVPDAKRFQELTAATLEIVTRYEDLEAAAAKERNRRNKTA